MKRFRTFILTLLIAASGAACDDLCPPSPPPFLIIDEYLDTPFEIDPPTELWQRMHADDVDVLGRDWTARCLDFGGRPILLGADAFCADTDY